ncbi:hypothetical protein BO226_24525 (plasmid) [Rhodococcus sp. 2G]|nr:hypothetical protein BO226_24525 [Rhodococcus sp. 2G]
MTVVHVLQLMVLTSAPSSSSQCRPRRLSVLIQGLTVRLLGQHRVGLCNCTQYAPFDHGSDRSSVLG